MYTSQLLFNLTKRDQRMVRKEKTSREQQFCGRKSLVDTRHQRRMVRLVQADRNTTVIQIRTSSTEVCRRAYLNAQHVGL